MLVAIRYSVTGGQSAGCRHIDNANLAIPMWRILLLLARYSKTDSPVLLPPFFRRVIGSQIFSPHPSASGLLASTPMSVNLTAFVLEKLDTSLRDEQNEKLGLMLNDAWALEDMNSCAENVSDSKYILFYIKGK